MVMQTKNVYSVGQVNRYIKNMFTQDFFLKKVYIKGEVSNFKHYPSGHIYFTLKDEESAIKALDSVKDMYGIDNPAKESIFFMLIPD